jgi:hypothetical protein
MNLEAELLALEERFWKGDVEFYRRNFTEDSIMAFPPPLGMMAKEATIAAIANSDRWADVAFDDVRLIRLAENVAILAYAADARREGEDARYSAVVSSAYVRQDGTWKLAFHQQTPAAAPPDQP